MTLGFAGKCHRLPTYSSRYSQIATNLVPNILDFHNLNENCYVNLIMTCVQMIIYNEICPNSIAIWY